MNLIVATQTAIKEASLADALTWICNWEADRIIHQALEQQRTGVSTAAHGKWDTCFKICIESVMEAWQEKEDENIIHQQIP